jgi:hypothetical protein
MGDLTKGAWFGDPDLKARMVQRMKEHRELDSFMQGRYQSYFLTEGDFERRNDLPLIMLANTSGLVFKGCAVGCLLSDVVTPEEAVRLNNSDSWHQRMEEEFGIPWYIASAMDRFFESRGSFEEAGDAAVAMVEAIPVGGIYCISDDLDYIDSDTEDMCEALASVPIAGDDAAE